MQGGHAIELLEGGGQFFPALEAAIDQARHEVSVETYIFHDDPSGRRIAAALGAAAARGVRTQLIVDGFGTRTIAPELKRLLGRSRVEIFRPERRSLDLSRTRLRRLHRKLAVVDGCMVFVGGINLLDDFVDPNHGVLDEPRFDFAVCVRGPLVAPANLAMYRMWWELATVNRTLARLRSVARMRVHAPADVVSDVTPAGPLRASLVLRDNFRFRRTIEQQYLEAIRSARRRVVIANAYFFPGVRMRRALLEAARRGVRVLLLLQGRVEYRLQHYASQALYDELLRAGVEIVEYRRSFLHAKVAVVDDWSTVGSSNIDPFSLLLAREANVMIDDAGFAQHLCDRIEAAVKEGGVPVVLQRHARRSLPVRLMNSAAFLLLRIGVAISGAGAGY
jgi:cardiolipin synthase